MSVPHAVTFQPGTALSAASWISAPWASANFSYKSGPIQSIRTGFLQKNNSWIFLPQQVEYSLSDDGKNFTVVASIIPDVSPRSPETIVKTLEIRLEGPSARYLRVLAKNIGHCPDWHYGAGGKAWIFVDEIVVD